SIAVAPAAATTTVGLRSSYTATGTYSNGITADLTTQVTWATGAAATATISNVAGAEGQLLARAVGTTSVTATLGTVSGSTTVTESISVTPVAPLLPIGTVVAFTAEAIFSDGTSQNVTANATWVSSAPAVLAVTSAGGARGRGTALAVGSATVTATFMGLSGS